MGQAQSTAASSYKLYINNRVFGIATGFEFSEEVGRRAIYGLDQITPYELAPGTNTITGRIDCIKARNDGGLEGRGVATSHNNRLLEKYISIMLVDRITDKVVFRCDEAAVNNQTWRTEAKMIMRGSFTFTGISRTSENE
jgi:hypothetical protein